MPGTTVAPRGRLTAFRLADQADFQTPASSGFVELNTYGSTFNNKRPLEADDILGPGNYANSLDDRPPAPGLTDADGSVSVPFDLNQLGFWLKGALGAPVSAAVGGPAPGGTYAHTFASGKDQLPVRTLERCFGGTRYETMTGAIVTDMTLPIGSEAGYAKADVSLMGRAVSDPLTASVAGSPTVIDLSQRVPTSAGAIAIGGANIGRLMRGSLKITPKVTMDRYSGDRAQSDAFVEGYAVSFSSTARYVSDALRTYGATGADGYLPDAVEVIFTWQIATYKKLIITLPAVRVEPVTVPVQNGGLMTLQVEGRAEVGASAAMLTAVLTNQKSAY